MNFKQTISLDFEVIVKEKDGVFHCHVPDTDLYYFARIKEDIQKIGLAGIQSFINYWKDHNGGNHAGARELFDEL